MHMKYVQLQHILVHTVHSKIYKYKYISNKPNTRWDETRMVAWAIFKTEK